MATLAATDLQAEAYDFALAAYDRLAPHYDALTEGHDYARWLDVVEALAVEHGLPGKALLDVACGTGKSFLGMLERGYEVVACDLSPEMVACAREKVRDGAADVFVADMRALPEIGRFDLVTCLDDAINYLTSPEELSAAIEGFARNLRPGGIAVFDVNALCQFRTGYAQTCAFDSGGAFFCLQGEGSPDFQPGGVASMCIEVFSPAPAGLWRRTQNRHVQRHHPRAEVERAVADAGLELAAVLGQSVGVRMSSEPDESLHSKIVYVVRRPT